MRTDLLSTHTLFSPSSTYGVCDSSKLAAEEVAHASPAWVNPCPLKSSARQFSNHSEDERFGGTPTTYARARHYASRLAREKRTAGGRNLAMFGSGKGVGGRNPAM
jgi:hypothetical protein